MSADLRREAAKLMREDPRFWSKVGIAGADDCWLWMASTRSTGYGRYWSGVRTESAHRYAYEQIVGPIPGGLVIDHLCRIRLCVNPKHLEPVTTRENVLRGVGPTALAARQEQCKAGHAYTPENTYRTGGRRCCRACNRVVQQNYAARKKESA